MNSIIWMNLKYILITKNYLFIINYIYIFLIFIYYIVFYINYFNLYNIIKDRIKKVYLFKK